MSSSLLAANLQILQSRINQLLATREYPKTICPSEVPRALTTNDLEELGASCWRDLMSDVRELVWQMRDRGEVEILQRGEVLGEEVGLEHVKGPIRVRRKV